MLLIDALRHLTDPIEAPRDHVINPLALVRPPTGPSIHRRLISQLDRPQPHPIAPHGPFPIARCLTARSSVGMHIHRLGGHGRTPRSRVHHVTIVQPCVTRATSSVSHWASGPGP